MSETTVTQDPHDLAGLGGWLVLVGLGLVVAPIRLCAFLVQTFPPIFLDGTWDVLTTPGTDAYHALWGPLIVFELLGNGAFIAGWIAALALFFRRSRRFPPLFITLSIGSLLFILVDAWLASFILTDEPMIDPETATELGRSLVSTLAWVPYMLVSKRVRNTFLE